MAVITLHGKPIHTIGNLPVRGTVAAEFILTKTDLGEVSLKDFAPKRVVLNIFPSIDTPVCAMSVRRFNEDVSALPDTVVLCISMDLPFAHARFCGAEGLKNVVPLSAFRRKSFGSDYGVTITDGPMEGLLSRAVVIIDANRKVIYTEQVPEIAQEPDYQVAIAALR
jgi:thiol peroxidase